MCDPLPRSTRVCTVTGPPTAPKPASQRYSTVAGTIGWPELSGQRNVTTLERGNGPLVITDQIPTQKTRLDMRTARPAGALVPLCSPPLYDPVIPGNPEPQVEIRVRSIYPHDEGTTPYWTLQEVQDVTAALVEAANRDLAGTGIRFVCFVRHDVEIRADRALRRDIDVPDGDFNDLISGTIDEIRGQIIIDTAAQAVLMHRNEVAAERPNSMLWLFSSGNAFKAMYDGNGKFLRWEHSDDRGGSFSGGDCDFVALHLQFLTSVAWARADASKAVHECGHYFGLGHTHREPYHDPQTVLAEVLNAPAAERLSVWRRIASAWLDGALGAPATAVEAERAYDVDYSWGITDTPADPGADILQIANEAAGNGPDALGGIDRISLQVIDVDSPVDLVPLRDNPMSYYLAETTAAMRFTSDQITRMRSVLLDGGRRPLVAAQLGDTATPDLRICAVWSPNSAAQRLAWGHDLISYRAEHDAMRAAGMVLVGQQAYTNRGSVLFDAVWEPGDRIQEIAWGWLDNDVGADLASRASRGLVPVLVQGYQHLDEGVRYNVVYEPGSDTGRVLLGVRQDELQAEWDRWSPQGYRMSGFSAHVDRQGTAYYSTVFRRTGQRQEWVAGWTLEDVAAEYGRQWNSGMRIRHIAVTKLPNGHRWSAVFEPDAAGQLVYWAHVRERILEIYNETWAIDFKLRAMWVVPA